MLPITDPSTVQTGDILYHPAFGFTLVADQDGASLRVRWEGGGKQLPERLNQAVLARGFALCPEGGFFARSVDAPSALRHFVRGSPSEGLGLLLRDLGRAQRRRDVEDWLVRRDVLDADAFREWWKRARQAIVDDDRFVVGEDWVALRTDPLERRERTPNQHLESCCLLVPDTEVPAPELVDLFVTGGAPTREAILSFLPEGAHDALLEALLERGDYEGVELTVIHGRRDPLPTFLHAGICQRLRDGGRPEAALVRLLARQRVEEAALALRDWTLSPHRLERLLRVLSGLDPRMAMEVGSALADGIARDPQGSCPPGLLALIRRIAGWDAPDMRARFPAFHALVERARPDSSEGSCGTGRGLRELQPLAGNEWIRIAQDLARLLACRHAEGLCVHPSLESIRLGADDALIHVGSAPGELLTARGRLADVSEAAWSLLDLAAGPLPERDRLPLGAVLAFVNGGLRAPFPPAMLGVLSTALCGAMDPLPAVQRPDPCDVRPRDGVDFWVRMERAVAHERTRLEMPVDPSARLVVGYDTHVGRVKSLLTQTNQDAILPLVTRGAALLAVCDGISQCTIGSGDMASTMVVQVLAAIWQRHKERIPRLDPRQARQFLEEALEVANRMVVNTAMQIAGGSLPPDASMGTTVVLAMAVGNRIHIASLGDSRAYLVGDWGVALLTADQNLDLRRIQSVQSGEPTGWDGLGKGLIGFCGHFEVDGRPSLLPVAHLELRLMPGERLVLCSDGITDYLGSDEGAVRAMIGFTTRHASVVEAAGRLVQLANQGGGGDNASVIVAGLPGLGEDGEGPMWKD